MAENIVKITEPYKWPITEEKRILRMISKRGLNCVSYRLPRNKSIGELLNETQSVNTDRIGLLLSAAPEGPPENADNKVCVL